MPRDIEKLHQTFRVFCLFLGLFNVVLLLGSVAILLSSPEPEADPETVPKWIAALCVPVGLLGAITSEATRNRKRWALDLIWIFAAIWLLAFPIGTVLGGYILYHFRTLRPYYG